MPQNKTTSAGSPAIGPAETVKDTDAWSLDEHWNYLVQGLADHVTEGVSALQQQLAQLLSKGRISVVEHRLLSIPIERIKLAGISAQQINRFYSGRIRQSHEKIDMAALIEDVLQDRKQELVLLGVALRRKLKPVDVLIDPTVAHTFAHAVLDWCMPFGSRVDVRLDLNTWPQYARLKIRVYNDGVPPSSAASADSLSWMLIRQIAQTAGGIEVQRSVDADGVGFTALFTRTVQAVDGIAAVDLSEDHSSMFKSLSGAYVLTISPSLQVRSDVHEALREIGIVSDGVGDFEQARQILQSRMPNLIVVDADIKAKGFDRFRDDLLREVFELPFVEISNDDSSFDMSGFGESSMAKVGRSNIREALGTAVMFELAKMM